MTVLTYYYYYNCSATNYNCDVVIINCRHTATAVNMQLNYFTES